MRKLLSFALLWLCSSCHAPGSDSLRSASGSGTPPSVTPSLDPEVPLGSDEKPTESDPNISNVVVTPVQGVMLQGRKLLVNGQPFVIRAVCWNPVRLGQKHPEGLMFRNPAAQDLEQIEKDFQLMKAMGANTLRTYEPILDNRVLDLVKKYQLHMIVPVFNYFATDMADVKARVQKLKDNPGTLFWEIGNEWNYNQFYSSGTSTPLGINGSKELIKRVITTVRSVDSRLPIATVHGELPSRELIQELSGIAIWGLNVYSGKTFGNRLQTWSTLTDKPMYFGEFGADAINKDVPDENSQAVAVAELVQEIENNVKLRSKEQVALGGAVFEWNDEWWKDEKGAADRQDIGGIAPGGGPYPDMIFNEEWWGLVTIDRKPRPAYGALQKIWKPLNP